jgi:ABC-2 type transport system permease protein
MLAILKKELRTYFRSPTGYIFLGFFLLLAGIFFALTNLLTSSPSYTGVLSNLTFVFLIAVPILTMRLLSEEQRHKTDILLLTNPVSVPAIVLGKYIAAVIFFVIATLVTVLFPIAMSFFDVFGSMAAWEIVTAYLGFILLGCGFLAVGLFISAMTENQVISAVSSFAALLFLWILDWLQTAFPKGVEAGIVFCALLVLGVGLFAFFSTRRLEIAIPVVVIGGGIIALLALTDISRFDGSIVRFFGWFSLLKRFEDFTTGILALNSTVYMLSFASVFVFLTTRVIERRRWS